MKRILRFNESIRFPKKVSSEEFFKKRSTHKMVDFSYSEVKQIKEILRSKRYQWSFRRYQWSFSIEIFEVFSRPPVEVVKLSDDWFTIIEGNHGPFYICDEIEEVLTYLRQL